MSHLTVSSHPLFVALLQHLWQTTLFTIAVWLLTALLHSNRAGTRFRLWLLASAKFLVPFSLLIAAGQHLRPERSQATAPVAFTLVMQGTPNDAAVAVAAGDTVAAPAAAIPPQAQRPFDMTQPLLVVWALGALGLLTMWLRRWVIVHRRIRGGSRMASIDSVPVITTTSQLEPGVFGIMRPVLMLPAGIHARLTPVELQAIVAHELSHVRRRDNLTAAAHMLVQAIFWFHPMVWVIGARMLLEREAACDTAVLEAQIAPETYAEGILKICRMYTETPVPCVAGVTGSDLKQRIVRIVSGDVGHRLNPVRRVTLAVFSVMALASPVLFGVLHAAKVQAAVLHAEPNVAMSSTESAVGADPTAPTAMRLPQTPVPPPAPAPPPSVEPPPSIATVIDPHLMMTNVHIQPSNPYAPGSGYGFEQPTDLKNTRFRATNNTVADMISFSYGVQAKQIIDGPRWIDTERYDITADVGPVQLAPEKIQAMLRRLLADHFGVRLRPARRDLQVYVMTVSQEGHHLRQDGSNPHGLPHLGIIGPGNLVVTNASMRDFCISLERIAVDRPLVDRTGLSGRWYFDLQWHPDTAWFAAMRMPEPRNAADDKSPPLLTAIREQLGLNVEPTTLPMNVLVLDHASRPRVN